MLLPEVTTLTPLAIERLNAGEPDMITTTSTTTRREALVATLRFVRIPLICAALVALTSTEPEGRLIALAIAVLVAGAGLAMHARELFGGVTRR